MAETQKIKIVVFDLGRTLMEYKGMKLSWISYYKNSFDYVNEKLSLGLSDKQIEESIAILTDYNPRIKPREKEIAPETIFADVTAKWNTDVPVKQIVDTFFESLKLEPLFYDDSIPSLKVLRERGYKIAALTDVATAMPDELHKSYVAPLLPFFDLYVSSLSCGYKKPNPKGLNDIAAHFGAEPDAMIMVGDDLRDVEVARRFGCASVLIERTGEHRELGQTYTISNLDGLLQILARQ